MEELAQPAPALDNGTPTIRSASVQGIMGASYSIEARSSDGRAITTLFSMQYQLSSTVDERMMGRIEDMLYKVYSAIEELF